MSYCEQEFTLSVRDESGSTIRQQLESVWRQTGKKPKELEQEIQLPEQCELPWKIFIDLNNTRTSGGFGGVNAISYQELYSYCSLYDLELEEWEIDLIKRFDSIVLNLHSKRADAEQKRNKKK